jgi:F-type H+-transporting ATPase subunit delta
MNQSLLKHYAQAFFALGKEKDKVDVLSKDMAFLSDVFHQTEGLEKFLSSPMILKAEKEKLLEEQFRDKVDVLTYGFLNVLIRKKAIAHFDEIKKAFDHLYHEDQGILEGRIYTPFELSAETLQKLEEVFSKKYGKKVCFRLLIDKNVIGGMRVYVQDTLYDYSIDSKLNQIKHKLTA